MKLGNCDLPINFLMSEVFILAVSSINISALRLLRATLSPNSLDCSLIVVLNFLSIIVCGGGWPNIAKPVLAFCLFSSLDAILSAVCIFNVMKT